MRTWTFPDAHPDFDGPWASEPDKAQWVDAETGLDCLIVRNYGGALCGYVGVPPGHPWHGVDRGSINVNVHGGLSFSSFCQEGAEDGWAVCHVPEPGRPERVWWLGFDCGHAFDLCPVYERFFTEWLGEEWAKRNQERPWRSTYKTFDYVRAEVADLARQVCEVVV